MQAKQLVFENGRVFYGAGFGANVERVCELVFNTSMVGYQEIYSDCAYNEQFVCMTYPLIGSYGLADEDYEARTPRIGGLVVREYNDSLANFRAAKTLGEDMAEHGIPGISGVDTRAITRMIRDEGSMRAVMCSADKSKQQALDMLAAAAKAQTQVQNVSCKKRWYARAAGVRYNVVAVDCGIKLSTIDSLQQRGCNVSVVPWDTTAQEIQELAPDGLLISSGPGNPADAAPLAELVRELRGHLPMLGIGLGHQIIAMAYGCKIFKLKFGHHGVNHPVRQTAGGRVCIHNQSHCYAVEADSVVGSGLEISHTNLLDGTVEGLQSRAQRVLAVQFYPGGKPGTGGSYDEFVAMMQAAKKEAEHHA